MNIRFKKRKPARLLIFAAAAFYVLSQTACAPTYPKELVDKAVIQLCKEEYGIDVGVKLADSTIAVYLPIENLLDQNLGVSKDASEKINDVLLSVSRVTLSTDAPIEFYIVITQDPAFSEVEVVIIRYVNDLKLLHFNQISRGEFTSRALIELKLTPQVQKEKILKSIFEQLGVQESEELLSEFLRKDVSTIGDIGYWNNQFFIKEINLEEFLALQIAGRAARAIQGDPEFGAKFKINYINGKFIEHPGGKSFEFEIDAVLTDPGAFFMSDEEENFLFKTVLDIAGIVLGGYKFKDFQTASIVDKASGDRLIIAGSELEDFRKGKLDFEDLIYR